jgi:BirA family biotin operon repressor/biotin-[acetyl-CoA-carboxylase] ligase
MSAGDLLSVEAIRRRLTARTVGRQIYIFGEVDSTNARLRALARSGAAAGTVVLAEGQTAGRGRHGQPWFSPSGVNLHASALFRPELDAGGFGVFSFIASLALADAVKDAGAVPAIKWPNDVLVDGKKVGGALVEFAMRGPVVDYAILGVGANLNVELEALRSALGPAGRFATSLAAVTGQKLDRNHFAASYLDHLDTWAETWKRRGPAAIRSAWADRDILTGRRIEARGRRGAVGGRVTGLDAAGALVMEDPLGHRHTLIDEEIRLAD